MWAAPVALAFVALGMATAAVGGTRADPNLAGRGGAMMAEHYLSITCRCPWFPHTGAPWSIHGVHAPFRYRVLVPWLAGFLPFAAPTSLSLVTYASLAATYWFVLLSCRRLGISAGGAMAGVAVAYAFETHLSNYWNPFLVDGVGLMTVALMVYAVAEDAFWLFAIAGILGVFAREALILVLPAWCARDLKRGTALTLVAAAALSAERWVLFGPPAPSGESPALVLISRLHAPVAFATGVFSSWRWAFAVAVLGLTLLPAGAFRRMAPISLTVFAAALASGLLAAETARYFGIVMPIVAIAAAQLVAVMVARRSRMLLAGLGGLVLLEFIKWAATRPGHDPTAFAAAVRPLWLAIVWVAAATWSMRHDLTRAAREKLGPPAVR